MRAVHSSDEGKMNYKRLDSDIKLCEQEICPPPLLEVDREIWDGKKSNDKNTRIIPDL